MSSNRYKPRLKKGILKNKRFLVTGKNLRTLKKNKWKPFLKKFINTSLLETLIRNDVSLIPNRILRLEKSYSRSLYYKRQLSSFFSTFRGVVLHSFSLESSRNFFLLFLEFRVDLLLLRAKLAKTLYHARWLVSSGFLFINRSLTCIPSFRLRQGDFLQVRKDNLVNNFFFNLLSFKLVRHDILVILS
jgi:ribosomal protein S4